MSSNHHSSHVNSRQPVCIKSVIPPLFKKIAPVQTQSDYHVRLAGKRQEADVWVCVRACITGCIALHQGFPLYLQREHGGRFSWRRFLRWLSVSVGYDNHTKLPYSNKLAWVQFSYIFRRKCRASFRWLLSCKNSYSISTLSLSFYSMKCVAWNKLTV